MTATNRDHVQLQPHPLDEPDARGLFLAAEVVTVVGFTGTLIFLLGAIGGTWPLLTGYALSVMLLIATALGGRTLRSRAWDATPGAFGARRWRAPRNPARFVRPIGDTLVLTGVGVWVLGAYYGADPDIAALIATSLAMWFAGGFIGSVFARRGRDYSVLAVRLVGPIAVLALALIASPAQHHLSTLFVAAFLGAMSLVAGLMVTRK